VVPAGRMSVTVAPPAGAGPALFTTIEYVIGCPVPYGPGDAVFAIARSSVPPDTLVLAEEELFAGFESGPPLVAVAVFMMFVPPAVPMETWSTIVNVADAPLASVPIVQTVLPLPPGAGFEQANTGPLV